MTFEELIKDVSARMTENGHPTSFEATRRMLTTTLESIKSNLSTGGEVRLAHFGNFKLRHAPAREFKSGLTQKMTKVSEKFYVQFRPTKALKESLPKSMADLSGVGK